MTLQEQIDKEYIEAYKGREEVRLQTLRLLKTAIKNRLVELKRPRGSLEDSEVMDVIIKQAKQRQDSIEQYLAAKRSDLADKEAAELEILQKYLPRTIEGPELDTIITKAIELTGATGPREMGKVIGHIMAAHKGAVDGKILSEAVKKRLAG